MTTKSKKGHRGAASSSGNSNKTASKRHRNYNHQHQRERSRSRSRSRSRARLVVRQGGNHDYLRSDDEEVKKDDGIIEDHIIGSHNGDGANTTAASTNTIKNERSTSSTEQNSNVNERIDNDIKRTQKKARMGSHIMNGTTSNINGDVGNNSSMFPGNEEYQPSSTKSNEANSLQVSRQLNHRRAVGNHGHRSHQKRRNEKNRRNHNKRSDNSTPRRIVSERFEGGFYLKNRKYAMLEFIGHVPLEEDDTTASSSKEDAGGDPTLSNDGKAYVVRIKDASFHPYIKVYQRTKKRKRNCDATSSSLQDATAAQEQSIVYHPQNSSGRCGRIISEMYFSKRLCQYTLPWPTDYSFTPLACEERVLPLLLKFRKKERGTMNSQPSWRIASVERACRAIHLPFRQALSLRRHHMRRYNPYMRHEQLQLGTEEEIRQSAELYERAVEDYLQSHNIPYWTENDQRRMQNERYEQEEAELAAAAVASSVEEGSSSAPTEDNSAKEGDDDDDDDQCNTNDSKVTEDEEKPKSLQRRQHATPDFVFPHPVLLKDHHYIELIRDDDKNGDNNTDNNSHRNDNENESNLIHWLEVKHFYGASTICSDGRSAVGSILSKAQKYVDFFGGRKGAIVFGYGCGDLLAAELAALGVLALDGSHSSPIDMTSVDAHMATYCLPQKTGDGS